MSHYPEIIGVTGYMGSGKDTVGDFLVARYGYAKLNLADPLKRMCSEAYGIPLENFYDRILKEEVNPDWEASPRTLCRIVGKARRHTNPNYWTQLWVTEAEALLRQGKRVVCCDIRYPNEGQMIDDFGVHGKMLRIMRPGVVNDGHDSERHVEAIPVSTEIENDGSIAHLQTIIQVQMTYWARMNEAKQHGND
jgi:hypothetical protein